MQKPKTIVVPEKPVIKLTWWDKFIFWFRKLIGKFKTDVTKEDIEAIKPRLDGKTNRRIKRGVKRMENETKTKVIRQFRAEISKKLRESKNKD